MSEPFTIAMDESDLKRMKLEGVGDRAKINGHEVRLVGVVDGLRSLAAPWVFCSLHTARQILGPMLPPDHVKYLLARCDSPERARQVAAGRRVCVPLLGDCCGCREKRRPEGRLGVHAQRLLSGTAGRGPGWRVMKIRRRQPHFDSPQARQVVQPSIMTPAAVLHMMQSWAPSG